MIMKKYLLFLLAFLPMVVFTACSSSDDDNVTELNSLVGTEWYSPDDGDGARFLSFEENKYIFVVNYKGKTDGNSGTYTYNPPYVTLKQTFPKDGESEQGRVYGEKLTIGEITYQKR